MDHVFLLSPARCSGRRASYLLRKDATFELACRLRASEASLCDVFTFMSGLYFRGKAAYVARFGRREEQAPCAFVIVPGRGLVPLHTQVTVRQLRAIAKVPVDLRDDRYCRPLQREARRLHRSLAPDARVVLLGSIATRKYVELLGGVFGDRLHYPAEFRGIGDMSRGALMLRRAASGEELSYERLSGVIRRANPPSAAGPILPSPVERID